MAVDGRHRKDIRPKKKRGIIGRWLDRKRAVKMRKEKRYHVLVLIDGGDRIIIPIMLQVEEEYHLRDRVTLALQRKGYPDPNGWQLGDVLSEETFLSLYGPLSRRITN